MLTTFVEPRPNAALIRCLEPVNRLFNLRGLPILRDIPLINRIPGMRGFANIPQIDFPASDLTRLREVTNPETAAFLAPNHPEFFTDWMIDKEVMARLDVTPGCWATHKVVNGMGKWGQKFWLANNLIAQIPGKGGSAGKQHSVSLAKRGQGVLLHPEGTVHWVADQVGPLFSGVIEMAQQAANDLAESGDDRPVYIAPLVYKYMFLRDETCNLHGALSYLESALDLPSRKTGEDPASRLRGVYLHLTNRVAHRHGITLPNAGFWDMRAALVKELAIRLDTAAGHGPTLNDDPYKAAEASLRHFERTRRSEESPRFARNTIKLAGDLRELLGLQPWMYPGDVMTQEQVAERIQRLRLDWLKQRFRDKVHAFVPRPVGPRRAHIRVVDPIRIEANSGALQPEQLRTRLQSRLDDLNRELATSQAGDLLQSPFSD